LRKRRPADAERINNDLIKSFNQYNLNTTDYFDKKKEILTLLSLGNKTR
jgi:ABC-type antimicrobial peptide transport system permease subunit